MEAGMEAGRESAALRRRRLRGAAGAALAVGLAAACARAPAADPAAATSARQLLAVRPGETGCAAAGRLGIAPRALLAASGIDADPSARLPEGTPLRLPAEAPLRHRIARGETLGGLARHYGVPLRELAAVNGIADPARIHAGRSLRIPAGARTGCPPRPGGAPSGSRARAAEREAPPPRSSARREAPTSLAHADTLLEQARRRYEAADFEAVLELVSVADHLLEALPEEAPTEARRARGAWLAGLALTGLERRRAALERLRVAVELDPELGEDAALSPKVRALVEDARER